MKAKNSWLLALLVASCEAPPQNHTIISATPGGPLETPKVRAMPAKELSHAVFSLANNRHLAHWQRDGAVFITMSGAGVAKYLHFARPALHWKLSQTKEGIKGAAPQNNKAALEIPLSKEQAQSESAYVHVYSPSARKLTIKANGKFGGRVDLVAGWQTATIPLSEGLLVIEENIIGLEFSALDGLLVEWFQLGGVAPKESPKLFDTKASSFVLDEKAGASFYVQVPHGGGLSGSLVGDAACALGVSAVSHDGTTINGTLKGKNATIDLSSLQDQIVKLSLVAKGCPQLLLQDAALVTPGAAKKVERPKAPKYMVLWVMDTLRADKLRVIKPDAKPEIPVFEELATTGTVFASAYSQGNESRAGHASIWTSLYPVNHRMIGGKAHLAPSLITLDEAMKSAGFFTSGVSCNGYITDSWGFGSTWDKYRNHIHDGGGVGGADVMGAAIKSVKEKTDKPFFLYIGTIDTHVSWRAHEPWLSKYDTEPYDGPWTKIITGKSVEDASSGKMKITQRDKTRAIAFYDANVSYQDELVGKFLKQLKEWGIADETMIVFTSDHGEEMWEEGRQSHGATMRETLVHVPLIVHYPPLFPGGKVMEGVDTLDIIPTMLDAMGEKIPESLQGESLIALSQGVTQGYPRPSFSSLYERAHTMRLSTWKMDINSDGKVELFDLLSKERELKNVASERPLERRFLTDSMSTFLLYQKLWKKWKWGVASNATAQFSADLE
jgi:arylsulfatase A-like enzyme